MNVDEVYILKDVEGKIDIDEYFEEKDVPALEQFLKSLGVKKVYIEDDDESIETGKPFRYKKPSLQKRMPKEVDWENTKVIETVLLSMATDKQILKEIVKISGKVKPEESKATTFTVIARFRHIYKEYAKWKFENKIDETQDRKQEITREFAKYYVDLIKKKRQKRVQNGTLVYIPEDDDEGEIIEYDNGEYVIKKKDEFIGRYKRREFIVK